MPPKRCAKGRAGLLPNDFASDGELRRAENAVTLIRTRAPHAAALCKDQVRKQFAADAQAWLRGFLPSARFEPFWKNARAGEAERVMA